MSNDALEGTLETGATESYANLIENITPLKNESNNIHPELYRRVTQDVSGRSTYRVEFVDKMPDGEALAVSRGGDRWVNQQVLREEWSGGSRITRLDSDGRLEIRFEEGETRIDVIVSEEGVDTRYETSVRDARTDREMFATRSLFYANLGKVDERGTVVWTEAVHTNAAGEVEKHDSLRAESDVWTGRDSHGDYTVCRLLDNDGVVQYGTMRHGPAVGFTFPLFQVNK